LPDLQLKSWIPRTANRILVRERELKKGKL